MSTSPPRVLIVSRAPRGGHPRYCAELARSLADEGARVGIVQPASAFAQTADLLAERRIDRYEIPTVSEGWFAQERAIAKTLLAEHGPGLVIFEDTSPLRALLFLLLKRRSQWSLISMVHNTRSHSNGFRDKLRHWLGMSVLAVPHRVLVHNTIQRNEILANHFNRSTNVDVVPHGVWSDNSVRRRDDVAAKIERSSLLMFGVMRDNSGLGLLGEVAPQIANEFPNVRLSVVGKPASPKAVEHLDLHRGMENVDVRSEFVTDTEIDDLFTAHDFLVLPYEDYSSVSGVLMQAISHNIPVVTSGMTSVAGRVEEFGLGPSPTGSLHDQLVEALTAPLDQVARWRANSVEAREQLSWKRQAEIILSEV